MKAIFKQNKTELLEAIKISFKDVGKVLIDTDTLKQEIVKEKGKLILRSHEIDNSEAYSSILDIDVFLNENDILLKSEVGYTKPIRPIIELSKEQENIVKKYNNIMG